MRRRILVIEDEPDLVRGLRDALEFEGFEVLSSGLGREGVRILRERGPDLVLLDLMLPDANGFSVCEEIRATHPLVPVIMLTARSQETDKIRGLDVGADDYVTKPFSIGELVARINAIFRRLHRAPTAQRGDHRSARRVIDPRKHELRAQGEDVARCRSTRSSFCGCSGSASGSRSRARRSWRKSGASPATPPPAASTTSWSSCARRSRRTPPSPATSSRSTAPATSWCSDAPAGDRGVAISWPAAPAWITLGALGVKGSARRSCGRRRRARPGAPRAGRRAIAIDVDVHCHTFCSADLPIVGFVAHYIPGLTELSRF